MVYKMHHICGMRQRSKCIITLFLSSRILEMVEIYFFLFRLCKITNVGVLCRKNLQVVFIKKPSTKQNWGSKKCESIVFDTIFIQIAHKICITFCYRFMFAIFYRRAYLEKSKIKFFIRLYQSQLRLDAFHFDTFISLLKFT